MAPRADGITVVWAVSRRCRARVECRAADGTSSPAACDGFGFTPQSDDVIRVRLDGLAPGATYQARAIITAADDGETIATAWQPFRTLDPAASATRFVVWNDTHAHAETTRQLHAATPPADFLVWNGDTGNNWDEAAAMIPTLLHPGGCDISAGHPLCLTWGNHDLRGPHAFRMPRMVATPSGRSYYAFRSGPVGVVCLNTGEDKPDDHPSFHGRVATQALRLEQAVWLAEVIQHPALRDAPHRVVFCHLPLHWLDESPQDYERDGYDRHSGSSRAAWGAALAAWGAQVVISGHTHQPAWLPPTADRPYGQLTGGGPEPENATWLEGTADPTGLRLRLHRLDGVLLHDLRFSPLA